MPSDHHEIDVLHSGAFMQFQRGVLPSVVSAHPFGGIEPLAGVVSHPEVAVNFRSFAWNHLGALVKRRIQFASAIAAASIVLAACQTMPSASYSNYGDNSYALHKLDGAKIRLGTMTDNSGFDSGCRLVGPIKTAGNRPLSEFIHDAFNDEFKFAGVYSDDASATNLTGTLRSAEFTSMTGMTQGHWSFSVQLANPANGKSLTASTEYDFDSGFIAEDACRNVSNALTPAVQRLINKAVSDPSFPELIGFQPKGVQASTSSNQNP